MLQDPLTIDQLSLEGLDSQLLVLYQFESALVKKRSDFCDSIDAQLRLTRSSILSVKRLRAHIAGTPFPEVKMTHLEAARQVLIESGNHPLHVSDILKGVLGHGISFHSRNPKRSLAASLSNSNTFIACKNNRFCLREGKDLEASK